jgi:hypothetical protein
MTPLARHWLTRRQPAGRSGWHAGQRICPTCSHVYTPGSYRAHLRSFMHRQQRGWWR